MEIPTTEELLSRVDTLGRSTSWLHEKIGEVFSTIRKLNFAEDEISVETAVKNLKTIENQVRES